MSDLRTKGRNIYIHIYFSLTLFSLYLSLLFYLSLSLSFFLSLFLFFFSLLRCVNERWLFYTLIRNFFLPFLFTWSNIVLFGEMFLSAGEMFYSRHANDVVIVWSFTRDLVVKIELQWDWPSLGIQKLCLTRQLRNSANKKRAFVHILQYIPSKPI